MRIVVGDIGGTHARFALADLRPGEAPLLGEMHKYQTRDHDGLASAWAAFARDTGATLPAAASLGIAAPIEGEVLRFVNSGWQIHPQTLQHELGLERLHLLNDFGAVANAVSVLPANAFGTLCGPDTGLPPQGITTIIGPGTGLGVSILIRRGGPIDVIETESAHIAFAPQTAEEARLEAEIRARYGRCSVERIVSGPGLLEIYASVGGDTLDPGTLWAAAIDGSDPLASRALDIFIGCFGAAAGDFALAHGAMSVVISSGLSNRIGDRLHEPSFGQRFTDKGRYRARMERIPVLLSTYDEPGLLGAAVAFERRFLTGSGAPARVG